MHAGTHIDMHFWFLLQPSEMALLLFLLDRLSFPVLQNLSFNFTPLQVLPQWRSPSASTLFSASCGPTLSYVALSYSYSPPWSSLCVFLLYFLTRDGLCVTHVCIPTVPSKDSCTRNKTKVCWTNSINMREKKKEIKQQLLEQKKSLE